MFEPVLYVFCMFFFVFGNRISLSHIRIIRRTEDPLFQKHLLCLPVNVMRNNRSTIEYGGKIQLCFLPSTISGYVLSVRPKTSQKQIAC